MSVDILDPAALTSLLPTLLPPSAKNLDSPQHALAALLHTAMAAVGFRLIGVDESLVARQDLNNVLPEEWSLLGPGSFTFRYKHEQSSLEFVVKVIKLGSRTLVNAIALEVRFHDLRSKDVGAHAFFRARRLHRLISALMTLYLPPFSLTIWLPPMPHPLYTDSSLPIELRISCPRSK